jgi:hypothetical protein
MMQIELNHEDLQLLQDVLRQRVLELDRESCDITMIPSTLKE